MERKDWRSADSPSNGKDKNTSPAQQMMILTRNPGALSNLTDMATRNISSGDIATQDYVLLAQQEVQRRKNPTWTAEEGNVER